MLLKDFSETFADELKDPDFAAAYLQTALEDEGADAFLVALNDVAQANGETAGPAQAEGTVSTDRMQAISQAGGSEFKALNSALRTYGMRFAILRGGNASAQG